MNLLGGERWTVPTLAGSAHARREFRRARAPATPAPASRRSRCLRPAAQHRAPRGPGRAAPRVSRPHGNPFRDLASIRSPCRGSRRRSGLAGRVLLGRRAHCKPCRRPARAMRSAAGSLPLVMGDEDGGQPQAALLFHLSCRTPRAVRRRDSTAAVQQQHMGSWPASSVATRCCCPPDSCAGRRSIRCARRPGPAPPSPAVALGARHAAALQRGDVLTRPSYAATASRSGTPARTLRLQAACASCPARRSGCARDPGVPSRRPAAAACIAAAGRAEEGEELALADGQRDILHSRVAP